MLSAKSMSVGELPVNSAFNHVAQEGEDVLKYSVMHPLEYCMVGSKEECLYISLCTIQY